MPCNSSLYSSRILGVEIDKLILRFTRKCKRPTIAKAIQERREEVGGLSLPGIRVCKYSG